MIKGLIVVKYILSLLLGCITFGCVAPDASPGIDPTDKCMGFIDNARCCAYCSDVLSGEVGASYLCDDTISKYKWELLTTNGCNECASECENYLCLDKGKDLYMPDASSICFDCVISSPKTTEYFSDCQADQKSNK